MRITAFVTNTTRGQLADLELRHRRRARAEDRIRCAKDIGLANLPLHDFAQNQIWCALVALAADLVAWLQTLVRDVPLAWESPYPRSPTFQGEEPLGDDSDSPLSLFLSQKGPFLRHSQTLSHPRRVRHEPVSQKPSQKKCLKSPPA
jgi:Transposase DDE domain group 1